MVSGYKRKLMISNPAAKDKAKSRLEAIELTLAVTLKELQDLPAEEFLAPEEFLDLLFLADEAHRRVDALYAFVSNETWKSLDQKQHPSSKPVL